jgi:hypothetical protein
VKLEEKFEPTPYTIIGTLVHDIVLEDGGLVKRVSIQPDEYEPGKKWTYQAKVCKSWRDERIADGKLILKKSEYDDVLNICEAICKHPDAGRIIALAKTEVSVIAFDETNKVPFRCRMDIVPDAADTIKTEYGETVERFLADIKVVSEITDRGLERNAYDRGLHIQAAAYLEVWNSQCGVEDRRNEFVFIFVENTAPYSVRLFRCSEAFLQKGREDMARYLKLYAECTRTGIWPGYPETCQELNLPGWVRE